MAESKISLSINPSYFCNFDCNFCYLTPEQLNNRTILDLDVLSQRIFEVEKFYKIKHVDIYGGEISLLGDHYLKQIVKRCSRNTTINFITNLSKDLDLFSNPNFELSVSWDGRIRRQHEKVYQNIIKLTRPAHLLLLASPEMLKWSDCELHDIVNMINKAAMITTVEIKPYSINQSNHYKIDPIEFEKFVMKWFSLEKKFLFINEENLKNVFKGTTNSFSSDHIYITPKGDFAVLEFDEKNREYFKELGSIEDYIAWCNNEQIRTFNNSVCNSCQYLGRCLTEHIRHVESIEFSCDGYFKLIEWYRNEHNAGL
jgi:sulfatase maturation enzyme AslB (radical SAM superfamily)